MPARGSTRSLRKRARPFKLRSHCPVRPGGGDIPDNQQQEGNQAPPRPGAGPSRTVPHQASSHCGVRQCAHGPAPARTLKRRHRVRLVARTAPGFTTVHSRRPARGVRWRPGSVPGLAHHQPADAVPHLGLHLPGHPLRPGGWPAAVPDVGQPLHPGGQRPVRGAVVARCAGAHGAPVGVQRGGGLPAAGHRQRGPRLRAAVGAVGRGGAGGGQPAHVDGALRRPLRPVAGARGALGAGAGLRRNRGAQPRRQPGRPLAAHGGDAAVAAELGVRLHLEPPPANAARG